MPNGLHDGLPALQGDLLSLRARARAVFDVVEGLLQEQRSGSGSGSGSTGSGSGAAKPIPINLVLRSGFSLRRMEYDLAQYSHNHRAARRSSARVRKTLVKKLWRGAWGHWKFQRN